MFRPTAVLNAAAKVFAAVPDTILHNGTTFSKVGLAPFHQAWFFADGHLILASEEGIAATDATVYAPTDEYDMGGENNRRGSKFTQQGDIRHLAADQVTEAQLMLPETAGVGPERKAMMAALEADGRLKLLRRNRAVSEVIDERITAAKASRARAEKAQERLYARIGAPRRPATINWQSDLINVVAGPVRPPMVETVAEAA